MPDSKPTHGGLRLLAMLAVAVLVFGLPRLLRTCEHGDHRHFVVAFAGCTHTHSPTHGRATPANGHSASTTASEQGGEDDDERLPPVRHDERRGTSTGSPCEPSTPPRPFAVPLAPCATIAMDAPWLPPAADRQPNAPPPATGPPRPDERTALRRTTRLQV